jgi:transcriptional regulator with XRE-family HTH domain
VKAEEIAMPISGVQVKTARRLLGWSQLKLTAETGVSAATIANFEEGKQEPAMLDLSVVHRMLKDGGVEFDGEEFVMRRGRPSVAAGNHSAR